MSLYGETWGRQRYGEKLRSHIKHVGWKYNMQNMQLLTSEKRYQAKLIPYTKNVCDIRKNAERTD